jgi:Tfp pilus assembly protein PilN
MRAVNLLPAERRKRERTPAKLTPLHGAALGVLVGGLALAYWGHSVGGQVDAEKTQLADLEAQTDTLTQQIATAKKGSIDASTYEADRALVSGLVTARVNWSTVTINLARVAPKGVWLTNLEVTTPTTADAATAGAKRPAAITLQGNAPSRTEAALFLARLNGIAGFVEPRLVGGIDEVAAADSATGSSAKAIYSFSIEIPVDDAVFGTTRPARPTAAPATTTPPSP